MSLKQNKTVWGGIYAANSACKLIFLHIMWYAHHQELESVTQMVAACGIWCFGFQVVGVMSGLQAAALAKASACKPDT